VEKLNWLSSGDSLLDKLSRSASGFPESALWRQCCGKTEVACQKRFTAEKTEQICFRILRVCPMEAKLWKN